MTFPPDPAHGPKAELDVPSREMRVITESSRNKDVQDGHSVIHIGGRKKHVTEVLPAFYQLH